MSNLEKWVVSRDQNVFTSKTNISNPGNEDISDLANYIPAADLPVVTRIGKDNKGVPTLLFDVSTNEGWSQATREIMCSLRFKEIGDTGILLAGPNLDDGSLAKVEGFSLHQARLLEVNGKRTTILHWFPLKGRATDYVLTCWTW